MKDNDPHTEFDAYARFLALLEARRGRADPAAPVDLRAKLLSARDTPFNVGFERRNLRSAFSANLPRLFPNLVAIDDEGFGRSRSFLVFGAIVEREDLSHASALKLIPDVAPEDDVHLFEMGFLASCNSWSEAISNRSPKMACLGYVYDDVAQYYMADYPNRLNARLNSDETPSAAELARARLLIDAIAAKRISKYNSQPFRWPALDPACSRRVLVVDQNFSDASTLFGRADAQAFERMLEAALEENPDAEILVKTHPDLNWTKNRERKGYFDHLQSSGRLRLVRDSVNPFCLFDLVDQVYVGTSGMGLEALFAGKKVTVFGAPFYAGWGLTDDRAEIPHRRRGRTLEELFHYFYVWYTIYHLPDGPVPAEIEDVIDYIEANRPATPPSPPETAPRLSIVMPVFNVEKYLDECLDSIAAQSFGDYEIIAVDDVSQDGGPAILAARAASDARIRPIRLEENLGPGFARNVALKAARGDYVVFIDPDDYMPDPEHLSRLIARADADDADMIRYRKAFEQIEDETGALIKKRRDRSEDMLPEEFSGARLEDRPEIAHSRHFWNWAYRRRFLVENDIAFLTTYREERAFLAKAYLNARRISNLDSAGVVYRIRRDSAVRRAQSESDVRDQLSNFEHLVEMLRDFGAFDPESRLHPYARFQVSQFLHYLFFGFAYKTSVALAEAGLLDEFFSRLRAALLRSGLASDDLTAEPILISARHMEAGAYHLMFEAVVSGRRDIADMARHLQPVPFSRLMEELLRVPGDAAEARFQQALSAYARNERVTQAEEAPPAPALGRPTRTRVILHAGATKTGSTFLQHFFERNRAELLRRGVWYPEVGLFHQPGRPHKQAGHSAFGAAAVKGDPKLRDHLINGLALIPGEVHTILLSSEAFFLNDKSHRIAEYLQPLTSEAIVYLRRQDEWANSQYCEFVGGGALGRVSRSMEDWLADPKTRRRMDYRTILDRFAKAVGRDRVHVRVYDRASLIGGDLVADFAEATGLPQLLDLPRPRPEQANDAQLPAAHLEVMRHFNTLKFARPAAYLSFVEQVIREVRAWREARGLPLTKPMLLDVAARRRILDEHAAGNAEIARDWLGRSDGRIFDETLPREDPAPDPVYAEEFEIFARAYERWKAPAPAPKAKPAANPKTRIAAAPGRKRKAGAGGKRRKKARSREPVVVDYGLFGWRLWLLSPVVRRVVAGRAAPEDRAADLKRFDRDPASFFRRLESARHRRIGRLLYPERDPMGPFGIFQLSVRACTPFVRALGSETDVERVRTDPIRFFRTMPKTIHRALGRALFPVGELRTRN